MPETLKVSVVATYGSRQYRADYEQAADVAPTVSPSVPAAKSGSLTTRTDANTGTLTMSGGHGITTGAVIDLYWSGGSRYNVVVGTVATNSVPIDNGSGDDLPAAATAITAMVQHAENLTLAGDDMVGFTVHSPVFGHIHFYASDGTTLHHSRPLVASAAAGGGYSWTWFAGSGVTNPVAGDAVGKLKFSHGTATAQTMRAVAFYS